MQHCTWYPSRRRQSGATLVMAMLILVLIMMLGIVAVSSSNTQYKLAGNIQFEDSALNRTETVVASAESWLISNFGHTGFSTTRTPGLLWLADSNAPFTMAWNDSDSISLAGDDSQRYTIQLMSSSSSLFGSNAVRGRQSVGVCNSVNTYLITARGLFARGATKVLQSYYSVLNCVRP